MRKEDLLGAFPLFLRGRDLICLEFPATEVRYSINYDPGNAAAEVDDLEES